MISFMDFKNRVNELYSMGKLEVFADKDEHSHDCYTLYLFCPSADSRQIKVIEGLKPEYWNIIPFNDQLQIYINQVHVNEDFKSVDRWLEDNLYLKIKNLSGD